MNRSALYWRAASFAVAAGFIGLWQLVADQRLVSPVFLPGPDRAWASLMRGFASGDLLDKLAVWAPTEELRRKILVANPEKLYGFDPV